MTTTRIAGQIKKLLAVALGPFWLTVAENTAVAQSARTDGLKLGASTALSAVGTILAGRAERTNPSVGGAIVGALIGAVAAVGTEHLVREEMSVNTNRVATLVIVSVTQGLVTAATSRLFVQLRKPR